MFCPNCGTENKDDAVFCKSCGSRFPEIGEAATSLTGTEGASSSSATPANPAPAPLPQASQAPQAQGAAVQPPLISTPRITVPAQGVPVQSANARGKVIGIGIACVVVVVLLVVLLMNVLGGGGQSGTIAREGEPSVVVDSTGARVELLQRPTLVDLSGFMDSFGAAPALTAYTSGSSPSLNGGAVEGNELNVDGDEVEATNGYGSISSYEVSDDLGNVVNAKDFSLTAKYDAELIDKLEENSFAVNAKNGSNEFFEVYESNRYMELANFVTTDSIMHTYHLYFAYLLKSLEQNNLSSELTSLTHRMLDESIAQQEQLVGTEWESAANRNVAFFATALKLLDPSATVPASVASEVDAEVSKINAAQGMDTSGITGSQEDYSQYKPRGYYEGNEKLERYFRAMMLYGRTHFLQDGSSLAGDADELNRSALLINLALGDDGAGAAADKEWESIYTVTSFFAGASDDCGFYEYYPLIAAAYGDDVDASKLAGNVNAWNKYKDLTSKVEPPKISSVVVVDESQYSADDIKGFRFMGQRFSLDEAIFQQLVYDNVADRMLPSALDVPAALGSNVALDILEEEGQTQYAGYTEQMDKLRTEIAKAGDSVWQGSLYSQWLYTLNPLLVSKDDTYPAFMNSEEWDRKNLQTWQGSYTELKHDTILYSKQVLAEMGGGPLDHDDRGYVEPEPELYGRLSNLAQVTVAGLVYYDMISEADVEEMELLQQICDKLKTIAEKELAGTELSSDEYDFIRTYGGQLEHFWDKVNNTNQKGLTKATLSPAPLVADIATDGTNGVCLELAIGKVNEIYVVVPINGELHLTSGAVFSDYQFTVPISERMTDSTWRSMLGIGGSPSKNVPDMVEWVDDFTVTK